MHDIFSLPSYIWVSYRKSLSNESKMKLDELKASEFTAHSFVAILDEVNIIIHQISSDINARESENAICIVLRSVRYILAIDAFANTLILTFLQVYRDKNIHIVDNKYQPHIGKTVEFIYDPNSGAEVMQIRYDLLKQGKCIVFVSTGALDCIAYTNTIEAGISFEVTGHFDIVIAIINIVTPVHVETLTQMLYRIHDYPYCIISIFYQKNSNELFCLPGHENIQAELANA
ncbi:13768_t:CDS:2 [Funneliformis geosporum]|uniref:13768_t:CDS:1 n=1 Tax=Funneliformis geosporum TaxID=1117311 RepID=A0A9W4WU41_9GLOM|nr:13768_t:CDS:2 [Funneliformis geosporum]